MAVRTQTALFLVAVLAVAAAPLGAAPALEQGGEAACVEVIDGDTLVLDDGRQVRLVGIQAPKLPLGRPGFQAWPLAAEAKAALEALALGQLLTLAYGGRRLDRHGRALAHLHDASGRWLQGELLRRGLARVYSFRDNRALIPEMLALEGAARAARRGIWGDPFYRLRTTEEAARHVDTFQLVEGRVLDAAVVRGRAYLNFGPDWRTDFTATISPKDRRAFDRGGVDPLAFADRRVRVRGWIKSYNGPMIEVTHPEQIEVLEE
jgi:endonuclease YncB( thermonuclease family)